MAIAKGVDGATQLERNKVAASLILDEVFTQAFESTTALAEKHIETIRCRTTVDDQLLRNIVSFVLMEFLKASYATLLRPKLLGNYYLDIMVDKMDKLRQLVHERGGGFDHGLTFGKHWGVFSLFSWFSRLGGDRPNGWPLTDEIQDIKDMIKWALTQNDLQALEILLPDSIIFACEKDRDHLKSVVDDCCGDQDELMKAITNATSDAYGNITVVGGKSESISADADDTDC